MCFLGESFDRQASFRKVVSNTDSLPRRPHNPNRRRTVAGIPDDVSREPGIGSAHSLTIQHNPHTSASAGGVSSPLTLLWFSVSSDSLVLPGQFSTVGRPAHQQKKSGEEGRSSARRIRAPRGDGMSSLMASLTSSPPVHPCRDPSTSSAVHSLPRLATNSSLNSETSCNSASYRTLSASSSCCQVSLGEIIRSSVTETK